MRKAAVCERVKPDEQVPENRPNFLPSGGVGRAGSWNKDAQGRSRDSNFTRCTCSLKRVAQSTSDTANYKWVINPLSLCGGGEGDGNHHGWGK